MAKRRVSKNLGAELNLTRELQCNPLGRLEACSPAQAFKKSAENVTVAGLQLKPCCLRSAMKSLLYKSIAPLPYSVPVVCEHRSTLALSLALDLCRPVVLDPLGIKSVQSETLSSGPCGLPTLIQERSNKAQTLRPIEESNQRKHQCRDAKMIETPGTGPTSARPLAEALRALGVGSGNQQPNRHSKP
jgi:hypothetical protein